MGRKQETLRLILRDRSAFWNKYKHQVIFRETTFTISQKNLTVIEGYVLMLKTKPSFVPENKKFAPSLPETGPKSLRKVQFLDSLW